MEKLSIKNTLTTPKVDFDADKGLMEIEGTIIQEDATNFFEPLFNWIDNYSPVGQQPVTLIFRLLYYNTSASKRIFTLMKKADNLFQKGCNIKIVWEYEDGDDDSMQDCEGFKRFLKLPVEIHKI